MITRLAIFRIRRKARLLSRYESRIVIVNHGNCVVGRYRNGREL